MKPWNNGTIGKLKPVMKKLLIALLVILAAYAIGAAVFAVANGQAEGKVVLAEKQLLADGDMEASGTSDWGTIFATISKQAGAAIEGKQIIRVLTTSGVNGAASQGGATIGKTYHVTGWARGDGGTQYPRIQFGGNAIWKGTSSNEWQRIDAVGIQTTDTNFYLSSFTGPGGYVEFDDILVTEYFGKTTISGSQLLADGDMEAADTSAWTAQTYATLSKVAGARTDGRLLLRATRGSAPAHTVAFNQNDVLTVGKAYKVKGWMRKSVSVSANVYVTMGTVHAWEGDLDSTDWQYIDGVAVADDADARFYGGFMGEGEYSEWDDLVITEYSGKTLTGGSQLLADGDMEAADTSAWSPIYDGILSKENGGRTDGKRVLRITYDGTTYAGAKQTIIEAGKTYRVSGWARGNGAYKPRVVASDMWTGTVSTDWQRFDMVGVVNADNISLRGATIGAGYAEFDDVVVVEL